MIYELQCYEQAVVNCSFSPERRVLNKDGEMASASTLCDKYHLNTIHKQDGLQSGQLLA